MDHVLLYTAGVVLFTLGVALSIGLHEFGHLVPGKLFNVKVTQYFIGFGRTLWSKRRGETEYGIKAIPLGGYVKLVGMLPPNESAEQGGEGELVVARPTGMFAQLVSDAKRAEYEHVDPADHDRLFYRQPVWKRIVIMVSGVTINIVLAFVLFAIAFMGFGVNQASTTIGSVSVCVKVANAASPGDCGAHDPLSPANAAGLRPGDKVLSFAGHKITAYSQLQALVRAGNAEHTSMVIERDGKQMTLPISPVVNSMPSLTGSVQQVNVGFIGITPLEQKQTQSIGYVFSTMVDQTGATLSALGHLPQKVYHVGRAALGLEKRDPNSLMSVVGAGRVAGEVAAAKVSVADRLEALILLLGGLNLFLGLVNLVPLPPFDGAGVATALVEAVRSRWAKIRGRPDPGVIDAGRLLPLTYAMAILLLVVSVILIYADIVAPVSIS